MSDKPFPPIGRHSAPPCLLLANLFEFTTEYRK
jgi:hypothetical protein